MIGNEEEPCFNKARSLAPSLIVILIVAVLVLVFY